MKKILPIILLIIIVVVGFFVLQNKKSGVTSPEPISGTPVIEEPRVADPVLPNIPLPRNYSYRNDEFHFAVTLPGLVVTRRQSSDPILNPTIFTFGMGDQSTVPEENRVPNTMAVYIWKNKAEFDLLMIQMTPVKETIHGLEFDKYTITEGEVIVYRYALTRGDITYDVGVFDPENMKKFYILN